MASTGAWDRKPASRWKRSNGSSKAPTTRPGHSHEAALLRATDELHSDAFVSDATWNKLAEQYDTRQMMDVVFAAGQYNLVSMALNTLGVQLEPGTPGLELD